MENVPDVPEKPNDMSEPAYVAYLFEHHCEFCLCPKSKWYWDCRMRACKRCFRKNSVLWDEDHPFAEYLEKAIPLITIREHRQDLKYCPKRIFKPIEDELKAMQDEEPEVLQKWSKEKMAHVVSMRKSGYRLSRWRNKQERDREEDKIEAQGRRQQEIRKRLYAMGWQEEIENYERMQPYRYTPSIFGFNCESRNTRTLTDKEWTKIEPQMLSVMNRLKDDRVDRVKRKNIQRIYEAFSEACKHHRIVAPHNQPRPHVGDLIRMDLFKHTLALLPLETDNEDPKNEEAKAALAAFDKCAEKLRFMFPLASMLWIRDKHQELLAMIDKSPTSPPAPVELPSFEDDEDLSKSTLFMGPVVWPFFLSSSLKEQGKALFGVDDDELANLFALPQCKWVVKLGLNDGDDDGIMDLATTVFRCTHSTEYRKPCLEPLSYPRVLAHQCARWRPGRSEERRVGKECRN